MELIISGRHVEVDDELKGYAEGKLQKLALEYPKLTSARVVLSTERNWQIAEAHVNGKHLTLNASKRTQDMAVSIDGVVDKLERQLRKYLERIQEHRGGKPLPEDDELTEEVDVFLDDEDEDDEEFEDWPVEAAEKA
jgi:putative sigma-54 modulation protein